MGRAPCCDKATVKKGPWSPEEDAMLKNYIEEHGTGGNWIALPHKIGLKRCGKSCRLRWLNYLRPNIKHGDFTPEEDSIICSLYISIGSRWSIIAAQLPGRTDNDVKNYWNTKLKKRLLGRRKDQHRDAQSHRAAADETTENVVMSNGGEQALSASAMERIQLCMQLQQNNNTLGSTTGIHHTPLLWPPTTCRPPAAATLSANNSFNSSCSAANSNVTVAAADQGQYSSSLNEEQHLMNAHAAAMDGGLGSPSSAEDSDVVNIEAELQELLYGEANNDQGRDAAMIDGGMQQGGDMDWWSYDVNHQSKPVPVNCWDFTPEPNAVFQDYASVYDI